MPLAGGSLRLLELWCGGASESRRKARREFERSTMPNDTVPADVRRVFSARCAILFSSMVLDDSSCRAHIYPRVSKNSVRIVRPELEVFAWKLVRGFRLG